MQKIKQSKNLICKPMKKLITLLLVLSFIPIYALDIHVAPNGSDSNKGTKSKPLLTIEAAQKKLREESFAEAKTAFDDYKAGKYQNSLIEKDHNVKVAIVNTSKGELPKYEDAVSVNYYGFFDDGKSFDSSFKVGKPYSFVLGRGSVIQGWDIGIPSVAKGATAIIDIPYPMAYGKAGSSAIPPRSNLFFWVKVEDIQKPTIK